MMVRTMRPVADTPPWDIVFHTRVVVVRTSVFRPESSNIFLKRLRKIGRDGTWEYVNPKAITCDELYVAPFRRGWIDPGGSH